MRQHAPESSNPRACCPIRLSSLLVWDSGLHAKPRRFDLTQRRNGRNGAFRVRSPWRSWRTLRGIDSARLPEMAANSGGKDFGNTPPKPEGGLPNSSQPPAGLGFRSTRETSAVRSHATPQRTQRFSLFLTPLRAYRLGVESDLQVSTAGRPGLGRFVRVWSPWRSLRTLRGIGAARLSEMAANSGGKGLGNTPPDRRTRNVADVKAGSPVLRFSRKSKISDVHLSPDGRRSTESSPLP